MLEKKFYLILAISYFPGGRVGGGAEMKLKLTQFKFNWNFQFDLSLAKTNLEGLYNKNELKQTKAIQTQLSIIKTWEIFPTHRDIPPCPSWELWGFGNYLKLNYPHPLVISWELCGLCNMLRLIVLA